MYAREYGDSQEVDYRKNRSDDGGICGECATGETFRSHRVVRADLSRQGDE